MAITAGALLPEGARVKIGRGPIPADPTVIGRVGTIVDASEYRANQYGVVLDGEQMVRMFQPAELEVVAEPPKLLTADRESAKRRRALP